MGIIFWFSSRPSDELLNFGLLDWVVKKLGHALGYGCLALSYWVGFEFRREKRGLAWGLALAYAVTDEFHQSFVPGRHPSAWDVVIFDNLGAMIGLWFFDKWRK
jgi:VanZ family protein